MLRPILYLDFTGLHTLILTSLPPPGETGVGKTAAVEGLAQRIVAGDVPMALRGVKILELDLGSLTAGCMMPGEGGGALGGRRRGRGGEAREGYFIQLNTHSQSVAQHYHPAHPSASCNRPSPPSPLCR